MTTFFVKTRHHYQPYDDYYRLVALSGYPIIYVDEIPPDAPHDTFIITPLNGEWMHGVNTNGRVILWDLEWRDRPPYAPGLSEVWASNPEYARRIGAKYVLLGSHSDFAECVTDEKIYDACHLSYVTPRREAVYREFERLGGALAPNAWGDERHNILCQSRCMLYVAQDEKFPALAPLRAAIAAAYRLPIISELGWDTGRLSHYIHERPYEYLAITAKEFYRATFDWVHHHSEGLYEYLCIENTFRKYVEAAL